MSGELHVLLADAADSDWAVEPSRRLAEAIEERIVDPMPSRLRSALGNDEAKQQARAVAWESCRRLAVRSPAGGVTWGYLANVVRWRLSDTVRSEARRRRRHPALGFVPERDQQGSLLDLGPMLDQIIDELVRAGLEIRAARRLILVAAEGPFFTRAAMAPRLVDAGAPQPQAEALAWLLRGGAANPSALARLASGESPREVFSDQVVRRWVVAAAGRDPLFTGGRAGVSRVTLGPSRRTCKAA
ncbi:hypothetical protein EV643_1393 [Kribbella sp. VKM Ac-2527]|uniref:Uncharacterized protein n=1 Tax=Kribbella caucasensis TaxID=2512215 RepID=A0A4R6J494_9ACTN|nr:hypothetical protein [Kribbella sp. VKM Ac-2527]TDO30204.1 hypothetical protein EV643_1393 [Kribbella sp. VKM Ac-2527]